MGIGCVEPSICINSFFLSSNLKSPSIQTQHVSARYSSATFNVITEVSGTIIGQNEREWGQIGVIKVALTLV